jgi:hypothetical protein
MLVSNLGKDVKSTLLVIFLLMLFSLGTPALPGDVSRSSAAREWAQFGHDAQRTNATTETVPAPWKLAWQWNGSGSDGKQQAGHIAVPALVQAITGNGRVYMVGNDMVYALQQSTGAILWSASGMGRLSSTPIYSDELLFVASENGTLSQLDAQNGQLLKTVKASSGITVAPLYTGNAIVAVTQSGNLVAYETRSLAKLWEYTGGSPGSTPASFSPSQNRLVYVTQDLFVHAVDISNGTLLWRVKPTGRSYTTASPADSYTAAEAGWPVIAEQHGIVFVRYRLEWNTLWTFSPFPETNAEIRSALIAQPDQQALFALKLSDGSSAFIPAIGNGGAGDGGDLPMGPQPVITIQDGQEVAYIIWRNGQTCQDVDWCDGREDATMGEMVLDDTTVPGYQAGDLRFVRFTDIQTDEMMNLTMSGDTLFHSHWLINAAHHITDRSPGQGATFMDPIEALESPFVIWRQCHCPQDNSECNPVLYPGGSGTTYCPSNCPFSPSHYCSEGLYAYGDSRAFPPGFYEYHNDIPNGNSSPFTVVSGNTVLVKTLDGAILAFVSGSPTANSGTETAALVDVSDEAGRNEILASPPVIAYTSASAYLDRVVTVEGTITSVVNRLPKALYLGFRNPHDGALLIRIFAEDMGKFPYDPQTLLNRAIRVTGKITLYWPENTDPEIVVAEPDQIQFMDK